MTATQFLAAVGLCLASLVGYIAFWVVVEVASDEVKEAVFRRPTLAVRRTRYRGLLRSGYLCAVLSLTCGFFALAIATNGRTDNVQDTRMFLSAAAILATVAAVLLTSWWRRAGRPQH